MHKQSVTYLVSTTWQLKLVWDISVSQYVSKKQDAGFPGGAVVGNLPADAGDTGSGPGLGGSHVPRSG